MTSDAQAHFLGTQLTAHGTNFRVWAPNARQVTVVFEDGTTPPLQLESQDGGYFAGQGTAAKAGMLYRYRLDDRGPYPDPASRYQPRGPEGPSMVVDPAAYTWKDAGWSGLRPSGQVLYEMHIGTFTREGTFEAAIQQLGYLADLGVTCLEVMPVAEFPGRFNWGYDGVNLFAPFHGYGDEHALRRFVDAAHGHGLGVILDVVYNHLGDEKYLARFSGDYFTDRYPSEWGRPFNFDGPASQAVREYVTANAAYWIREFHLDGLRLDATQSIFDESRPHVIAAIVASARAAAGTRSILITGENEPQQTELLDAPKDGGCDIDALWNDDFHHSARVALTRQHDGYFHDYRGRAQELLSAARHGFLFQGQRYEWQKKPRGSPALRRNPRSFITFTQNHDQVANTFYGQRLHELTSAGRLRAITALHLLTPQTPLLFMGQEFNASTPFRFFADHEGEHAERVWQGRRDFMRQFTHYALPEAQERIANPADVATFAGSKLDPADRARHRAMLDLHRDLLRFRREDPVIFRQARENLEGAVLAERALLLRWIDDTHGDRLLLVNLDARLDLHPAPEPLLAPPVARTWCLAWSSDEPHYGGPGALSPCGPEGWCLSAESASLLIAREPNREKVAECDPRA